MKKPLSRHAPKLPTAAALRKTDQNLAQMRRALRQAEDDLAGLHKMLKVAVPHGGKRTIPGTRANTSLLNQAVRQSLGSGFNKAAAQLMRESTGGLGNGGDLTPTSFAPSSGQTASLLLSLLGDGQRVG